MQCTWPSGEKLVYMHVKFIVFLVSGGISETGCPFLHILIDTLNLPMKHEKYAKNLDTTPLLLDVSIMLLLGTLGLLRERDLNYMPHFL